MERVFDPQQTSERTSPGFPSWPIWLLLLLQLLYVLGIGPAYRFLPGSAMAAIYRPLVTLEARCRPLDRFITWYMEDVWKCGIW